LEGDKAESWALTVLQTRCLGHGKLRFIKSAVGHSSGWKENRKYSLLSPRTLSGSKIAYFEAEKAAVLTSDGIAQSDAVAKQPLVPSN
jgi:hypothetical protein